MKLQTGIIKMALIKSGKDDTLLEFESLAVKASVTTPENLGQHRMVLQSGTIAASTAAGIIFSFRNASTNRLCLVNDVKIGFRSIAGNTVGSQVVSLWNTRSYTAIETTNISTAPILKNQNITPNSKARTALLRICGTAMATGGTGTDDTQPLSSLVVAIPGAISAMPMQSFFSYFGGFGLRPYPLVHAPDEGFRIRADTAFGGGTDTEVAIVMVDWTEVFYTTVFPG